MLGFNGGAQTLEAVGGPVTLPLYTGPDPSADPRPIPPPASIPTGPTCSCRIDLQWMVDFDRAVAAGMALAIALTPEQAAAGFDRLLVLGLQLGTAGERRARPRFRSCWPIISAGRSGFSLVPQGTPAHNTPAPAPATRPSDDADESFDDRKNRPLFTPASDPTQKRDGQWLAELLGLDPAFVAGVHGSGGMDQMQARAMQTRAVAGDARLLDGQAVHASGYTSIFSTTSSRRRVRSSPST